MGGTFRIHRRRHLSWESWTGVNTSRCSLDMAEYNQRGDMSQTSQTTKHKLSLTDLVNDELFDFSGSCGLGIPLSDRQHSNRKEG